MAVAAGGDAESVADDVVVGGVVVVERAVVVGAPVRVRTDRTFASWAACTYLYSTLSELWGVHTHARTL